jgi:hypothetical protein
MLGDICKVTFVPPGGFGVLRVTFAISTEGSAAPASATGTSSVRIRSGSRPEAEQTRTGAGARWP